MSTEQSQYLTVLQHRQINQQINSPNFSEISENPQDSSNVEKNASKLAVEVFEENQRLLAQIEQLKISHSNELRKLRDEYDLRIQKLAENEDKYVSLLREKDITIQNLKQESNLVDKDSIIQRQNEQIQKLNELYESAVDSRAYQLEKFQAMVEKFDDLTKENQSLKSQLSFSDTSNDNVNLTKVDDMNDIPESPIRFSFNPPKRPRPAQSSFNHRSPSPKSSLSSNKAALTTTTNPSQEKYHENKNNSTSSDNFYTAISQSKASTPPAYRFGKRPAPPNHPALKEQIPYFFSENNDESKHVKGFDFNDDELQTTYESLENERNELERKVRKVLPREHTAVAIAERLQREKDEERLDELEKIIGKIRLQLRKFGKL